MKIAMKNNEKVNLDILDRENYQFVYDEAKKGKLHCPICKEQVRLYLGIQEKPYFYHMLRKHFNCKELESTSTEMANESIEYVERNGFKIPVTRMIVSPAKHHTFQPSIYVKASPSFQPTVRQETNITSHYIKRLFNNGFQLDDQQLKAVTTVNGSVLVVAGAGSGKTRVLTTRAAYMLCELKIDPKSIMLVTFTAKAATEMKERLIQYPLLSSTDINRLLTGTFHSIFYRILAFHEPERWHPSKLIKKDWQKDQILKEGGKTISLDEKEFAYDLALQQIGYWKNTFLLPQDVQTASRWEEQVLHLYKYYEQEKEKKNLFDFDDMLIGCYKYLSNHPDVLEMYQNRFQYFLIDEFQDINKVQYELIKLLSRNTENLFAVGDDDQSIYAFRGSDPNYLLSFEKDFPNSKMIILNENYRSSHEIISTANRIIEKNTARRKKIMQAQYQHSLSPMLFYPFDEEEEATMIVQDIHEKLQNGYVPNDIAILYRTNTGSRAVFERLATTSFPFRIDLDSENFYERYLVKSMLSFLRLIINEDDQHAISQILPVLFIRQSVMTDLKANSILNDCSMLECLSNISTGHAFQERKLKKLLPSIRSLKGRTPLECIEFIEKEVGFGDYLKKRGNEGNSLEKGSDDIRDLKVAAKNFQTIIDFLDHTKHMSAMNKEIKQLSKQLEQAITLSTIHRAKGLEYRVVYILDVVDGGIPHDYALESLRNGESAPIEEERRLLYVAITRAKEECYIAIPHKRRGKNAKPSRFLAPILPK
ncbi:UvrD-helicase domain-containing protein [Robertmurraya sp. GLU-23]